MMMSNSFDSQNPYSPSQSDWSNQASAGAAQLIERVRTKVMVPAIFIIVLASLGLIAGIFGTISALVSDPPPIDPNAPEFMKQFSQGSVGPVAAAMQAFFVLLNIGIILGGVYMLRFKMWPLALGASILSMLNFGNCCCLLGIPVGIWALVILLMPDVKEAFRLNA
jgi:hypothetical protein